jgi:hypothetical protein
VVSGLLTEVNWRWTMLLPGPIALLALLAGLRLIPDSPRENSRKGGYDLPGALTGTAGMLLLVRTVVQAPAAGWDSARTLLCFALVAALLTAFVVIEHRSAQPLVRLGVLRPANQIRAHLGGVAFFGSYVGFQFLATQYMQYVLGWSALQTALAFLPAEALVTIASTRIGPVIDRFGTLRVIAVGFTALTCCYALFLRADLTPRYAAVVLPSMLLLGLTCTLTFPGTLAATARTERTSPGAPGHPNGLVVSPRQPAADQCRRHGAAGSSAAPGTRRGVLPRRAIFSSLADAGPDSCPVGGRFAGDEGFPRDAPLRYLAPAVVADLRTSEAGPRSRKARIAMASSTETGDVTGTKDKDYNLIWFVEACLSNALRMESYLQDAERANDTEVTELFRKAQADSRKGAELGKQLLRSRLGS